MSEPSQSSSQLSGPISSLSLPSEPPDVRNWFSSYVYESPSMGSDEGFLPSLQDSKCQNDVLFLEARQREEEKHLVDFDSAVKIDQWTFGSEVEEVPDTFQSEAQLSDITEPPDVRNWFSSYAYESPVLSTVFGEDSSSKEIVHGGEGHIDEKKNLESINGDFRDAKHRRNVGVTAEMPCSHELVISNKSSFVDEQHQGQPLRKAANSSDSCSQLSEPPHISNWFSSYVYESPELSTADGFREYSLEEKEPQRGVFAAQGSSGEKTENLTSYARGKIDETDLREKFSPKQATHPLSQQQCEVSREENLSAEDVATFELLHAELFQSSRDATENSRSPQADLGVSRLNKTSSKEKLKTNSAEEPSSTGSGADSVDQALIRSPSFKSLDRENERADTDGNGFVSVKKKVSGRSNAENDSRMPRRVLKECSGSKQRASCLSAEDGTKRRPLSDTTNCRDHSDVLAPAGKWKCPQKSKPNLGPPMKQLRLEKWVHLIRRLRRKRA